MAYHLSSIQEQTCWILFDFCVQIPSPNSVGAQPREFQAREARVMVDWNPDGRKCRLKPSVKVVESKVGLLPWEEVQNKTRIMWRGTNVDKPEANFFTCCCLMVLVGTNQFQDNNFQYLLISFYLVGWLPLTHGQAVGSLRSVVLTRSLKGYGPCWSNVICLPAMPGIEGFLKRYCTWSSFCERL